MALTQHHPRRFGTLRHVYPVISRRSGGLSLGLNLSPTGLCNFTCVYCQILGAQVLAEGTPAKTSDSRVPLDILEEELRQLISSANEGTLFDQPLFTSVPMEKRLLKDIAFSGDGEPTLSPQFAETVHRVVHLRKELCEESVKIVLITNASTLHLDSIRSALACMLQNNGEIWAKLDAGTPEFYQTVARTKVPFEKICSNLIRFTQDFPVVIQTCFLSLNGQGPSAEEVRHYAELLKELDKVQYVQIYTTARYTPEDWALPLENCRLDEIAEAVQQQTGLDVRTFYSM